MVEFLKDLPANAGNPRDLDSIPGLGRSPGGGNGNRLQYFCMENSMDRGAWRATVHGVGKSQTKTERACTHTHTHTHAFSVVGGCPLYCRMFGDIFVLHPLDVSSNYSVVRTHSVSRHCKMSPSGQNHTPLSTVELEERLQVGCYLVLAACSIPYLLDRGIVQGTQVFLLKCAQEIHGHFLEKVFKSQWTVFQALSSVQDLWKHC